MPTAIERLATKMDKLKAKQAEAEHAALLRHLRDGIACHVNAAMHDSAAVPEALAAIDELRKHVAALAPVAGKP